MKSIKYWPEDERPREKLLREGEHRLSTTELLAILLGSGTKGESAIELARKIMLKFKTLRNMSHTDIRKWREIKGLGDAKICKIKAAIEIGRRLAEERVKSEKVTVKKPKDVAEMMMPRMRDLKIEVFKTIYLDGKNQIIDIVEIEEGSTNYANPIIREIFHKALENFASSIICVHNHPSGDPQPSMEDKSFTDALVEAGKILNINVIDHIIIGDNIYYSFAEHNLI
ncbi:MAG TPA: JAB domain-containing protein [bacterium]|nr:JAB domain-containing protein [bacterium]